MFIKIQKMLVPLANSVSQPVRSNPGSPTVYCKIHFTRRIFIQDIGNTLKGALEVFSSIYCIFNLCLNYQMQVLSSTNRHLTT